MDRLKKVAWLILGVATSGMLLAASMPPIGLSFLAWVALVPMLVATHRMSWAVHFLAGIGVALVAASLLARGFMLPNTAIDSSAGWIYLGYCLFGLVIAAVMTVRSASTRVADRPWAMAAWATLLEIPLLLVLPVHMALSQSKSTPMLELASWTGIWGVSFCVWWANCGVAHFLVRKNWRLAALTAAICAALSLVHLPAETGAFQIAATQTSSQSLDELASLNERAGEMGAKLVVWPELSAMSLAMRGRTTTLIELAKRPDNPAFVTTFPDDSAPKPFNTAALFSKAGESERYRKRKPFAGESQEHQAGDAPQTVQLEGYGVGLCICFDSCFPAIMREAARNGKVDFIVLPSLDPDTPYGVIQALHGAWIPFRAAEIGLPIIRSEITAWSQIVDARGRTIAEAPPGQGVVLAAGIKPGQRWTLARTAGDWFWGVCLAFVVAGLRKPATDVTA